MDGSTAILDDTAHIRTEMFPQSIKVITLNNFGLIYSHISLYWKPCWQNVPHCITSGSDCAQTPCVKAGGAQGSNLDIFVITFPSVHSWCSISHISTIFLKKCCKASTGTTKVPDPKLEPLMSVVKGRVTIMNSPVTGRRCPHIESKMKSYWNYPNIC